ncbi:hypothetical protein [Fodinibius halophilus]|uniref:Uncharacterized protein n=1 Tax=Fodinibius halophilus TaxID=1736908 RepID=A0A6M1T6F3_9BACT|nr:hypothetical protein [Fodinibius halophilus]NGP87601.1 hypothetical protein [Fodinibius halophilus]
MKIQTSAIIDQLVMGDKEMEIPKKQTIELEFSAIDSGGGFKDPILDFSFNLPAGIPKNGERMLTVRLRNPQKEEHKATFSYELPADEGDGQSQINGRLKEDQLSREVIGFVLQLLR